MSQSQFVVRLRDFFNGEIYPRDTWGGIEILFLILILKRELILILMLKLIWILILLNNPYDLLSIQFSQYILGLVLDNF